MNTPEVGILIATFGDNEWVVTAARAVESALQQSVRCVVYTYHGTDLAEARNHLANEAEPHEWIIFLDADDELDPGYVEAMLAASGDIRQPATLGIVDGVEDAAPVVLAAKPLDSGNYVVIGAMIRRRDFLAVGGFDSWPKWEDWALWLKMTRRLGSEVVAVPEAVYRVHVSPQGRNHSMSRAEELRLFHQIRCAS